MRGGCLVCGERPLPERSRFCLVCGAAVPRDSAEGLAPYTPEHLARDVLGSPRAREGERKEVTVLFADIADSLAMAQALDPEDIHGIMEDFFELALDSVHAQRGTINQFRGDGFMALFGAPQAQEADAARALHAALRIREGCQALARAVRARFALPLVLRQGVHTGTVWVGSIGSALRRDYTAEGPTVGLAARLERAARPGQILVSADTARRARAFFDLADAGQRELRGIHEPVHVFELRAARAVHGRLEAEQERGLATFVGRAEELARLDEVASAEGKLRLVEIRGEAGIGKSRLVLEHTAGRPATPVLHAYANEEDATRAYKPWLELLRAWPEDLPGRSRAVALAEDRGDRVRGPAEFASEVQRLLEEREHPLVLVLEDIHWLDPSSREVLARLSGSASDADVLILATTRTDRAPLESRYGECIELGPLAPDARVSLARAILREQTEAEPLVTLAVERGGGNPLFIEEVSRVLAEGTDDVRAAARREIALRSSADRVPETLNGVIAARLDALPEGEKRLLQSAAVIGSSFDLAMVHQLEPRPVNETEHTLRRLVERGLLRQRGAAEFDFSHGLVREVGYGELLLSRRRVLHARCADALVRSCSGTSPETASRIGHHYDQAGQSGSAAHYLAQAGKTYLKLRAPAEAAAHLRRACDLYADPTVADPSEYGTAAMALASALNALDRAGEAATVLDTIDFEAVEDPDRRQLARTWIEGGWIRFSEEDDPRAGRRLIERGLEMARDLPGRGRLEIVAHAYLSRVYTVEGRLREAVASADRCLELALEFDDDFLTAYALSSRGSALLYGGEVGEALRACEQAATIAEKSQNEVAISITQSWLAQAHVYLGDSEQVLRAADRARATGERTDQIGTIYQAAAWAGEAYLLRGEPERAAREFDKLAAINDRWPSTSFRRARGLLALGHFDEARDVAEAALSQGPSPVTRARVLTTLGLALGLSRSGDTVRAEEVLLESAALCEKLGIRPHLAEAKLALARVCTARGDGERAERLEREAVALCNECGMPLPVA